MSTIGITGTNGKTTSAYLTAFLLERAGIPSGLVGTVETRIGGIGCPAERTTPEAADAEQFLQRLSERLIRHYEENIAAKTRLFPGFSEAAARLQVAGAARPLHE